MKMFRAHPPYAGAGASTLAETARSAIERGLARRDLTSRQRHLLLDLRHRLCRKGLTMRELDLARGIAQAAERQ